MPDLKILIADDHPLVRKGIAEMIKDEFQKVIIEEVSNSKELLSSSRKGKWDVVITDLSMPGGGEFETLKQLRAENNNLPILALSMLPEELYAKRALRAGASGYLKKDTAPEELAKAIKVILSGKKYISAVVAQLLAEDTFKKKKDVPFYELLSDREMEVFKLIASGKSVSDIATLISLSVPTISTYRTRILEKLNLKNNAELTHFAFMNNLI